ncbi:hypothetical protein MRS44_017952 [Fusarium solani]|uniref:uncharacterized protein n=1 Tax=Fusarium solani TaxID=169388 RepID=UPI0032C433E7|nr:hypothetical protein MRS44_017952 [Fusarium solani]
MVTVAIAGATGHIGKAILDILKKSQAHKVIALSRKAPNDHDTHTVVVDYNNIDSVADILESNGVHTIISAILVKDDESGASEINLVRAASKSRPTKRFVASDYSAPIPEEKQFGRILARAGTAKELRQTDLEWTSIRIGQISDSFGIPHLKSYLPFLPINIDVANKAAAIPGSGNDVIAYTYSFDMARFLVAALDLPKWDEDLFCYSDKVTLNEVVKLAEKITGSNFDVAYDSVEKLRRGEMTELPAHVESYSVLPKKILQASFAAYSLYAIDGLYDFPKESTLNAKFPEIKTTTIEDMLNLWKSK